MKRRIAHVPTLRSVAARALVTAFVLASASALAQTPAGPQNYRYGPGMMWGSGWGLFFGPLFMVFWLLIVIGAVALAARWFGASWHAGQPPPHVPPSRTPLDILKERYARGEIDKEEFEERRRVLGE